MVKTASIMPDLGFRAPFFSLPDASGKMVSLSDFTGAPALLIVFMCNHCPYVIHIADALAKLADEYQKRGVAVVGINSNDTRAFPEDSPTEMAKQAKRHHYTFPYLFDGTQEIAKVYHAACTPDFFVFDRRHRLVYRGQMDSSRPGGDIKPTGEDLRAALEAVLAGKQVSMNQKPSLGCNIKWQPGNAPDYF